MKKLVLCLVALLALYSCSNSKTYQIVGYAETSDDFYNDNIKAIRAELVINGSSVKLVNYSRNREIYATIVKKEAGLWGGPDIYHCKDEDGNDISLEFVSSQLIIITEYDGRFSYVSYAKVE